VVVAIAPAVLLAIVLAGCARPMATPLASASPAAASVEPPSPSAASAAASPTDPAAADASPAGEEIPVDLDAVRAALLGPSPVPEDWAEEVDEIMAMIESALDDLRLPAVHGLDAQQAACTTWQPLVGHQSWVTGALLERQVFVAHLAQLASVAPEEIRPNAEEALRVGSAAAAAQLSPDGDREVISLAPREELRAIGLWAVEHCDLPVLAEEAPDTSEWSEEDITYSCGLDRSSLERAMEEYREGPGDGAYAAHPHELEVSLDFVVYPMWHRIASIDNAASPPTYTVEPIDEAFCDR
jgi:hypothetical protein